MITAEEAKGIASERMLEMLREEKLRNIIEEIDGRIAFAASQGSFSCEHRISCKDISAYCDVKNIIVRYYTIQGFQVKSDYHWCSTQLGDPDYIYFIIYW